MEMMLYVMIALIQMSGTGKYSLMLDDRADAICDDGLDPDVWFR